MNIADGKYRARGISGAMGKTDKGAPQVAVEFDLLDHPGEKITWYGNFSETTVGQDQKPIYQVTLESLYHCGWISGDLRNLDGLDQNEVQLTIKNEEYQGKTRAKVAWVNPPRSGVLMKNAMPENELNAFAAKMKGASLSTRQALKLPAPGAAKPKPAPQNKGDAYEGEDEPPEWLNG